MSTAINDIEESLADLLPTLEYLTELCSTDLNEDSEITRKVLRGARAEARDVTNVLESLATTRALYPRTVSIRAALQRINRRLAKLDMRVITARSDSDKRFGQFLRIERNVLLEAYENVDWLSDYARACGILDPSETIVDDEAKRIVQGAVGELN